MHKHAEPQGPERRPATPKAGVPTSGAPPAVARQATVGVARERAAPADDELGARLREAVAARAVARSPSADAPARSSRALALRDSMRSGGRRVLARDLTKGIYVWKGKFQMNLKTQKNPGGKCGLMGPITFRPAKLGGDSTKIKLYQAVRLQDLTTKKEYAWTGADAARNAMQTTTDKKKGISPGWWIDILPAGVGKRTKKTDPTVSPYYRDYAPNPLDSQDGSKKGAAITEASLWDYPGWTQNSRFSFETVAQAVDTGEVYGTVQWGFTISDAAKGIVDHEYARGRGGPTETTKQALKNLNEYYANPGASTAPT
jgi:hypothetical protein